MNIFLEVISKYSDFKIKESQYNEILEEIALEGKIEKAIEMLQNYLTHLSNRDYIKFDEKYVKLIFYCIAMNLKIYHVKSEVEVQRKYPDIMLIPKNREKGYQSIMIEFKYLKKEEEKKVEEKKKEAREQIEDYAKMEEIRGIEKLNNYIVVVVNDQVYVERVG